MRCAFLLAYAGSSYFGFVRQPGKTTVEGELLKVFFQRGVCRDVGASMYRVAARTDRDVGALGQVIALDSEKEPDLDGINSDLPGDIAVLSAAEVEGDFNPRTQAVTKHYRYVCETPENFDVEATRAAAELLEGTHDFRCFCKREPGKTTVSKLMFASVREREYLKFDFLAPAFLRQQVRRMVSGLLALGRGEMDLDGFKAAIDGTAKHSPTPAPPEGLFLVNVRYKGLLFMPSDPAVEKFKRYLRTQRDLRSREMLGLLNRGF